MMKNNHNAPTTTTEELIVQYLDGELVRKELETVLFDRLSQSEEARMLLREYLVVRGAIRVSRKNERFQLSDDLDERTRTRIVQIMEAMETEELLTPAGAPVDTALRGFKADREAIASSPMSRQVKRWQIRGSLAALSILLTFGAVWLVTETTSTHNMAGIQRSQQPSLNQPSLNAGAAPLAQPQEAGISVPGELTSIASIGKTHSATQMHSSKNVINAAPDHITQNASQTHDPKVDEPASATQASDPAADMISHRYTKAIGDAKNEVVVSGHDRL